MTSPFQKPRGFKSPRPSPFRRPESPASPSPLRNQTNRVPSAVSPTKEPPIKSPAKQLTSPPNLTSAVSTPRTDSWTPPGSDQMDDSPTKGANVASRNTFMLTDHFESSTRSSTVKADEAPAKRPSYGARAMSETNALSKLQPAQVRELREGFQILDRDSDGVVDKDDVTDMLNQLGLPASANDMAAFFPEDKPMTMATFLNQISTLLATLSPPSELLNAFLAFDDDDSGQVDLAELRDALLHTTPDVGEEQLTPSEVDRVLGGFSGRRAFGKTMMGGKRGEVFKYQEFVNSIAGGNDKAVKEAQA